MHTNMAINPFSQSYLKGDAKRKALHKKINAGTGRHLTRAEQREKMKNWPKHHGSTISFPTTEAHKKEHQRRFGRAWND